MIYFLDNEILIKDIRIGLRDVLCLHEDDEDGPHEIILKDDFYQQIHFLSEVMEYFQDIPKTCIKDIFVNEVGPYKYEISIKRLKKESCEEETDEN